MNLREAAQQALEAWFRPHGINYVDFKPYMEALRAALTEPEQEPVCAHGVGKTKCGFCKQPEQEPYYGIGIDWGTAGDGPCCTIVKKLPSGVAEVIACEHGPTPPQRKPLTDEEIVRLMVGEDRVQLLYAKPDDPYFSEFAQNAIRELVESGRAIEKAHGIGDSDE